MTGAQRTAEGPDFGKVAVVSALVMFAILQAVAAWHAGWVFEYPLDDTYIHLAMASQIAHGGYGVNAHEYASAASSALYPVLLAPFADTAFQRFLPLIWNVIGMCLTMWLWGRALVWAGYRGWQGWVLAITVPLLAGSLTVAYTGMEHALHAAATVAIVFGLVRYLVDKKLTAMLFLGVFFSPLMRFEGLALVTMVIVILLAHRRYGPAVAAALLGFVPILLFMWFLVSIGLSPLPNSVQAKLVSADDVNLSFLARAVGTMYINLSKYGGLAISGLVATLLVLTAVTATAQNRVVAVGAFLLTLAGIGWMTWNMQDIDTYEAMVGPAVGLILVGGIVLFMQMIQALRTEDAPSPLVWLAIAMTLAGMGHVVLAQTGWMERYEHYLIVSLTMAVAIVAGLAAPRYRLAPVLAILALFVPGYYYAKMLIVHYNYGSRAINAQQAQMARFAQTYLNRNVAVNDLGRVSWRNPNYVLDLYGLANDEARYIRLHDPKPGWAGPLVAEHDVSVIMVYDSWMAGAEDPSWVRLGKLVFQHPRGFLGDIEVSFYARNFQEAAYAKAALNEWKKTLVKDTCFIPIEATKCPD